MMNNTRQCAKCAKNYTEIVVPWPIFPQCNDCTVETDAKTRGIRAFKHYLQVAMGLEVSEEQAASIIAAAKQTA